MRTFDVPTVSAESIAIHGVIYCSNSEHAWYSDGVKFVADQPFHLEYQTGRTLFENNGIGSRGGAILSDEIVGDGTYIGFSSLDGNLPGCYEYSCYTTITVKVVYD